MGGEFFFTTSQICKSFGPTRALVNVDIALRRGEICGLIGENGSGKSTLTSIIAGIQKADSGKMYLDGKEYNPTSMLQAQKSGVGMIVQEAGTLPLITVAENIFVGDLKDFKKFGLVSEKKINKEAAAVLKEIGAGDINPAALINTLNFEDRKIVEIARAMYSKPDILIIDESTTALAEKGRMIIYKLIKKMQSENKVVVFISHDLDELMDVCNTITVLRDGHKVAVLNKEEMSIPTLRKLMVGRELTDNYFRTDYGESISDKVVLRADRLTSGDGRLVNLNIELHKGEILGIGGLANSGMHELGKMLYGDGVLATGKVVHTASGDVMSSPNVSINHKIGYLSKDRDLESLLLEASILDNIALPSLKELKKFLLISKKDEMELSKKQIAALSIKCTGAKQSVKALSGGNKQKVALGKWLAKECDIFIMDCPTRGVDIGVKSAIYNIMYELKKQGKSIIMISEELLELIGMSDRILILKDGKINAEFARSKDMSDSKLIQYII